MRLPCLSLLLGLSACQIVGDPKDPDVSTSATATTSTGTDAPTTGAPACLGLDEQACAMQPGCVAHRGAPHVERGMAVCADFAATQFLACDVEHDPCPPTVITACPSGQPDLAFDIASGCLPPGFEPCREEPVPPCA
jgi:hypothetical protein